MRNRTTGLQGNRVTGWACALLVWGAVPAHAATTAPTEKEIVAALEKITDGLDAQVVSVLLQQQKGLGCEGLSIISKQTISVLNDPVNLEVGVGGRWVVRYLVDSCLGGGYRSVAFDGRRGSVTVEALVPGESLADPDLQADVQKSLTMAVGRIMPKCTEAARVRQTAVLAKPAKQSSPWVETWIATACGRDIGQRIEFVPGPTGTRFGLTLPKAQGTGNKEQGKN